jgi:HD-GYP domain-containing protein (c-di-GMP phosphodiesterase class II)
VYDALTTTRSYRAAMTHEAAVAEMTRTRGAWSAPVFEAFTRAFEKVSGFVGAEMAAPRRTPLA